jgi:hypothetical protein
MRPTNTRNIPVTASYPWPVPLSHLQVRRDGWKTIFYYAF